MKRETDSVPEPKSMHGALRPLSKLAEETGLSVHCIRSYTDRGLVSACDRTPGGYLLYSENAIERLRFIRIAREADVPVGELVRLFSARDRSNSAEISRCLKELERYIENKRNRLSALERCLAQASGERFVLHAIENS